MFLAAHTAFLKVEEEVLIPAQKFIFILPEYNGTFPGVLKAMIDNTDVRKVWLHKKALAHGHFHRQSGKFKGNGSSFSFIALFENECAS